MIDYHENAADSAMSPATRCFAITPSDSVELTVATKALYIGQAGDVVVRALRSTADVTFKNVPAGVMLDVRATFVKATGTTAGAIVGLA